MLIEIDAHDEAQLQERLKESPDLLPVDEFGLDGPLMVIGRETTLPSGAADLLCLSPGGDLLVVEFKTGPKNPDFRAALAQLLDYGSDLWQMPYDVFERTVAVRYFKGDHCPPSPVKGCSSLDSAISATWPDLTVEERTALIEHLNSALATGAFHYLVVAQRLTAPMEQTADYLNAIAAPARFYLVELIRFDGSEFSAFETRTVLKPKSNSPKSAGISLDEVAFLDKISDESYRTYVNDFFELCHGLALKLRWGTTGTSLRVRAPERAKRISIGWIFAPGIAGWMGLTDATFGYDPAGVEGLARVPDLLDKYVNAVRALEGAEPVTKAGLKAVRFSPADFVRAGDAIAEIVASLVHDIVEGS